MQKKKKHCFTWLERTWQDWFNSVRQLNKVVRKWAWLARLRSLMFPRLPGGVCLTSARPFACSCCMLSHNRFKSVIVSPREWTPVCFYAFPRQKTTYHLSRSAAWRPRPSSSWTTGTRTSHMRWFHSDPAMRSSSCLGAIKTACAVLCVTCNKHWPKHSSCTREDRDFWHLKKRKKKITWCEPCDAINRAADRVDLCFRFIALCLTGSAVRL